MSFDLVQEESRLIQWTRERPSFSQPKSQRDERRVKGRGQLEV